MNNLTMTMTTVKAEHNTSDNR